MRGQTAVRHPDQGRAARAGLEHGLHHLLAEGDLQVAAVDPVSPVGPETLLLEVDGVTKRFGGLPAVDGVTFGIDDGDIVAVVGPNGPVRARS